MAVLFHLLLCSFCCFTALLVYQRVTVLSGGSAGCFTSYLTNVSRHVCHVSSLILLVSVVCLLACLFWRRFCCFGCVFR